LNIRMTGWPAPRFSGQPRRLAFVYFTIGLALILPVAAAAWMGHALIAGQLKDLAAERAAFILRRAHSISAQFGTASRELQASGNGAPCSSGSIERMRQLAVRMNLLVGVGYVDGNELICSSFGFEPIDIGSPSYESSQGYYIRKNLPKKFNGSEDIILATDAATGYTAIIHKSTLLDSMPLETITGTGLLGMKSREIIAGNGKVTSSWFGQMIFSRAGVGVFNGNILAWNQSDKFDYLAYAVISESMVWNRFRRALLIIVPGGLLTGILLAWGTLILARMQTSIPSLIKAALKNGEFYLLYQPIVDLSDGRWVGAEALLRWRRATGEIVSPDIFIPIAEKVGLMGQITMRVLELVERDALALCETNKDFFISINFSAQDFSNSILLEKIEELIKSTGLAPRNFHIEATERVFLDPLAAESGISVLRKMGIEVAIDDFGTGFSGLAYLTNIRLDCLKIDKCFVQTICVESVTSNVIAHIIELAKSLNMKMIAEGTETLEQIQYLQKHGVHLAQGWYYGKPIPALEFATRMRSTM